MGDRHPAARTIARMAGQEEQHRRRFDAMMVDRGVRPTLLAPVWHVAGFALGAATALMGPKAAMACTAAIETEIDRHYGAQIAELGAEDPELRQTIEEFQADEIEHKEAAIAAGAEQAVAYPIFSGLIRMGCRVAIGLSKRI
jgi:ubiquinone biosynthesis monooxygenase Coq7